MLRNELRLSPYLQRQGNRWNSEFVRTSRAPEGRARAEWLDKSRQRRKKEPKMKSLLTIVWVLALPAITFGATSYAVQVNGASSASYMVGSVPNTLLMNIVLTLDQPGTFAFWGALQGQGTAVSRAYGPFITDNSDKWTYVWNDDATYLNQPLSALLDFGIMEWGIGAELPVGENIVVALGVSGLASLPAGTYDFLVVGSLDESLDDSNPGWANNGNLHWVDASIPFTLTVFTDCNQNGIPDYQDIATHTSTDCDKNGLPDECEFIDTDGDGINDRCDTCVDPDNDGFGDPGFSANTCPPDNCPAVANPDQADSDNNGLGDACEH